MKKEKIQKAEPEEVLEITEEVEEVLPEEVAEAAPKEEAKEKTEEAAKEAKPWERRGKFGKRGKRDFKRKFEEEKKEFIPKTKLGKLVKEGHIKDIDEIFNKGLKIMEAGIVDTLLPNLNYDLLLIGQAKGKFGGGKRRAWRQTQKKTAEENVPSFSCLVVVGDGNGHVGLGMGKSKETLPAREKALRNAKLGIVRIKRGCGSFDCGCNEPHSIPFVVEGKCGSAEMKLFPAPKGTGLVIEDECKKILKLAGIKDIYSRTFGQTKVKFNLATALLKALENTTRMIR